MTLITHFLIFPTECHLLCNHSDYVSFPELKDLYAQTLPSAAKENFHWHLINSTTHIPSQLFDKRHIASPSFLVRSYQMAAYSYAAACWDFTDLTQWDCGFYCDVTPGTQLLSAFHNLPYSMSGYLAVHHGRQELIVVFRPAQHRQNWITNTQVRRTGFYTRTFPRQVLCPEFLVTEKDNERFEYRQASSLGFKKALVHRGFLESWQSVAKMVMADLKTFFSKFPGYKLVFGGYSMGAALAVFPAIEAVLELGVPSSQIQVFTFGQPRIGNQAFVDFVVSLGFPIYRFVKGHDVIARLPPRALGYRHLPHEYWIVNNTHVVDCHDTAGPLGLHEVPHGGQDSMCSVSSLKMKTQDHFEYFWEYSLDLCNNKVA
jgi:hypothetical protein